MLIFSFFFHFIKWILSIIFEPYFILSTMKIEEKLAARSGNVCELCEAATTLNVYDVPPTASNLPNREIYICDTCLNQIEKKEELNANKEIKLTNADKNRN